ncbi:MAG TPA: rod shape-determining protein MreD [Bacteroidota bacterium]
MERYFRTSLVALGLLLLQTTFVPFLSFSGYGPDLLLIWVVYIAIRRGQVEAAVAGFLIGVLQDVTTTQFFGLAALAKTVAGFAAGYFFNENKTGLTLGTYRFALIIFLASLIHNILYYMIFFQGTEVSLVAATLQYSVLTGVYTSVLGFLPVFVFARKHSLT